MGICGTILAAVAGCVGNEAPEEESDNTDEPDNDFEDADDEEEPEDDDELVDYDAQYPFEVNVIEERHEAALEQMFEAMVLFGHAPDDEVDAPTLSGQFLGYYDEGEEFASLECEVEPVGGERSINDAIVTGVIVGQYAYEADNPPEGFDIAYYDIDGDDEPFDIQSLTAEEGAEFWEQEQEDYDIDDDVEDEEDDELTEEDVEEREEGEDVLEFDDLVIQEHELVIEEDDIIEEVYVEGVVENTGDEPYDYVEVGARVYNEEGQQMDRYLTNTTDLDGGSAWAFEINILEDFEDIDDYDIGVSGSRY